jgi:hypothetical protein
MAKNRETIKINIFREPNSWRIRIYSLLRSPDRKSAENNSSEALQSELSLGFHHTFWTKNLCSRSAQYGKSFQNK